MPCTYAVPTVPTVPAARTGPLCASAHSTVESMSSVVDVDLQPWPLRYAPAIGQVANLWYIPNHALTSAQLKYYKDMEKSCAL